MVASYDVLILFGYTILAVGYAIKIISILL